MTYATLLKIEGISGLENHPHHDILLWRTLLRREKSGLCALVEPLRQVRWPDKFKTGNIDRYDGSSNHKKFIQVYQTVIETTGGDDRVKVNLLPTALTGAARSWLINLLEGSIASWDQLCVMFIRNFQGTYEGPSTAETLKTIKQKHDESL
jgi:hypothetical protein